MKTYFYFNIIYILISINIIIKNGEQIINAIKAHAKLTEMAVPDVFAGQWSLHCGMRDWCRFYTIPTLSMRFVHIRSFQ